MEKIKAYLIPVAITLVALILYDMFVKKALKISTYEEYEQFESFDE